ERTLFYKNTAGFGQMDVSRDGRHIALVKTRTNSDNDIYLWDALQPDKEPVKITPHEGDVEYDIQTFSPNSQTLYYGSNQDSEFSRVWGYDLKAGERKVVFEDKWDVMAFAYSWKGRYREVSVNDDGRTATTVLDTRTGKLVPLPHFAGGNVTGV